MLINTEMSYKDFRELTRQHNIQWAKSFGYLWDYCLNEQEIHTVVTMVTLLGVPLNEAVTAITNQGKP